MWGDLLCSSAASQSQHVGERLLDPRLAEGYVCQVCHTPWPQGLHLLMSAISAVSCLALFRAVMWIPNQAQHPRQVGCYHGFYVLFISTPGNLRKCKYYNSLFAPGQLGLDMISDQRRVGSRWYWK